MTWSRKLFTIFLVLIILSGITTSHAVQDHLGNEIPPDQIPHYFNAADPFLSAISFSSPPGDKPYQSVMRHVYPVCINEKDLDCIVSVDLMTEAGKVVKGDFKEYVPVGYKGDWYGCFDTTCIPPTEPTFFFSDAETTVKGDRKRKIPDGSRTSIWTFPGLTHEGGNLYLVNLSTTTEVSNQNDPKSPDSIADWRNSSTRALITPIRVDNDTTGLDTIKTTYEKTSDGRIQPVKTEDIITSYGQAGNQDKICFVGKPGGPPICFSRVVDSSNPRFRLSIRLGLAQDFLLIRHWFVARASEIKIETIKNSNSTTISFEGKTIDLPRATALVPRTLEGYRLTREATNLAYAESGVRNAPVDVNDLSGFSSWSTIGSASYGDTDPNSIGFWSGIERGSKFLAGNPISVWSFETANISGSDVSWLWPCVKTPQLSGAISSNAAVMKPSQPKWNADTQSLEFRIASTHLDRDGKVAQGFYNLTVSEEVARCLWGENLSKARAEVTVVNQEGETKVFTTSYTIKSGYLNFQIYGFSYSVNTIQVRLTGADKKLSTSVSTTPVAKITCVKGKQSVKVSVTKGRCPAGFKKG